MANPQPDQHTRISNEILEAIIKFKFNGTQFRIVMAVWRYTYGFKRKSAELSLSFLSEATDIPVRVLRREIERLIENHVLIVAKAHTGKKGRELGFNKDYDQWITQNTVSLTEPEKQLEQEEDHYDIEGTNQTRGPISPEDQLVHTREDQLVHTREDQLDPQERKLKENIKENIYTVVFEAWNQQKIIIHRELTDEMKNAINKAEKKDGLERVLLSMARFGTMLHDPDYTLCSYPWGLVDFLTRKKGYRDFLDDGSKWNHYQQQKKDVHAQRARAPDQDKKSVQYGENAEVL